MKWTARVNKALSQASAALDDIEASGLVGTAKEFVRSIERALERHGKDREDEKPPDGD